LAKPIRVRHLLSVLLSLFPLLLSAQENGTYTPLRSSGIIPKEFITLSSDKFNVAKQKLDATEEKRTRQAKQNFLLESNFLIDQLLASGRVLFNDPVSNYLGRVLDAVLKNDPELRSKIRVYAVRSSVVNSFTTDDGIILVNLGLLAQLEDESQLAFILCHELVHYTEKHVLNAYVENQLMKQGEGEYRRINFDERMLARSRYSKELEKDADRLGAARFAKTEYSTESIPNIFEVMRYSHLPFDDIEFDRHYFDHTYYKVDESFFLDRVRPVEGMENDISDVGTHPSPSERQQLMKRYLLQNTGSAGKRFLVSEQEFIRLREMARFELSELYLMADQPVMAIYNSFLLQRQHGQNDYLLKNVAKALYTLSKYKTGGNYGFVHPGYTQTEGESQQVYHLLYKLQPEELCILATGHLWRLKDRMPHDRDVAIMADDLLEDLIYRYYTPGMFAQTPPQEGWNEPDTTQQFDSKYDRLKQKSKANPRLSMVKYGLVDLFANAEFTAKFDALERQRWGGKDAFVTDDQLKKKSKEDLRAWRNHGFALGLNRVAVVSPTYAKLDLRKNQQHKFIHAESAKQELMKRIDQASEQLALEAVILETSRLDSHEVQKFNDITFLNEWVDQRFNQLDVGLVNLHQQRIDSIIARYGTEHYCWTGVINYRENKPLMYFYLLYALIPPAIPLAVYYLVRPNYDTYYYCIVFDLKTGEPAMVNYNNYRRRDARDLINSSVYDSFWQLRQRNKTKG